VNDPGEGDADVLNLSFCCLWAIPEGGIAFFLLGEWGLLPGWWRRSPAIVMGVTPGCDMHKP